MTITKGVRLNVKGLQHVPSFKNSKLIARGRLITKPERQVWMEKATQSFVSQLISLSQTIGDGTWTDQQRRSWILSHLPEDDSRQWIKEIHIECTEVYKGCEGAVIEIERLQ